MTNDGELFDFSQALEVWNTMSVSMQTAGTSLGAQSTIPTWINVASKRFSSIPSNQYPRKLRASDRTSDIVEPPLREFDKHHLASSLYTAGEDAHKLHTLVGRMEENLRELKFHFLKYSLLSHPKNLVRPLQEHTTILKLNNPITTGER